MLFSNIKRFISTSSTSYPQLYFHPIQSIPISYSLSFLPNPPPNLSFSPTTIGILSHPKSSSSSTNQTDQQSNSNSIPQLLPRNFIENQDFVHLLHDVLKQAVLTDQGIDTLARIRQSGYIHIADERNPADPNRVPDPSDIIASILIQDSKINPSAYEVSRTHRLVTMQGMMRLNQSLHDVLVKALEKVREVEIQMTTDSK